MNIQEVFSPQEIAQFNAAGYSNEDIQQAYNEAAEESGLTDLQKSYQNVKRTQDPRQFSSNSFFTSKYNENLIQWQLELNSILETVEHMLRGDKIEFKDGHTVWTRENDPKKQNLNDRGVSEIMRILAMYLNRNTILSNYDEKTINNKVFDLGKELADLMYLKYESFGLDDLEKRKLYPIMVREIVDIVHSAYLRALNGGERDSLREARNVNQTDNVGQGGVVVNTGPSARERGVFNPMRYVVGKYK